MNGFINVYKPRGWTSHDMVGKLRRVLGIRKIGHTGTLDPNVDGVLLMAIGKATRLIEFLENQDKLYRAQIVFGLSTDTEDMTGEMTDRQDVSREQLDGFPELLSRMTGELRQVPPMVSAIRIDGKRLYQLARQGTTVERPARNVTVLETQLIRPPYLDSDGWWKSEFTILCSRGTYVRSYCRDLGSALGLPAVMGLLTREAVGHHRLENSWSWENLQASVEEQRFDFLIPPESELGAMPGVMVPDNLVARVCQGNMVALDQCRWRTPEPDNPEVPVAVYGPAGCLLAVGFRSGEDPDNLKMRKVFCN